MNVNNSQSSLTDNHKNLSGGTTSRPCFTVSQLYAHMSEDCICMPAAFINDSLNCMHVIYTSICRRMVDPPGRYRVSEPLSCIKTLYLSSRSSGLLMSTFLFSFGEGST